MASASTRQTTKTVIILNDTTDYLHWIEFKKTAALKHDVWKYCDPSIEGLALQQPKKPERPKPTDVRAAPETSSGGASVTMAVTFSILTLDEKEEYRILIENYRRELDLYYRQQEALGDLRMLIQETVHLDNLFYTFNCDTVYEMLVKLKNRFAPTAQEEQEILAKWRKQCEKPARNWYF